METFTQSLTEKRATSVLMHFNYMHPVQMIPGGKQNTGSETSISEGRSVLLDKTE